MNIIYDLCERIRILSCGLLLKDIFVYFLLIPPIYHPQTICMWKFGVGNLYSASFLRFLIKKYIFPNIFTLIWNILNVLLKSRLKILKWLPLENELGTPPPNFYLQILVNNSIGNNSSQRPFDIFYLFFDNFGLNEPFVVFIWKISIYSQISSLMEYIDRPFIFLKNLKWPPLGKRTGIPPFFNLVNDSIFGVYEKIEIFCHKVFLLWATLKHSHSKFLAVLGSP